MTRTRTVFALLSIVMASLFIANTRLARDKSQPKINAPSIQILLVDSKEATLPAEFQMALYENLVAEVQRTGKFQHVYRDGDRNATDAQDLVVLHSTVHGFKRGSERERQVTTVAGATSINIYRQDRTSPARCGSSAAICEPRTTLRKKWRKSCASPPEGFGAFACPEANAEGLPILPRSDKWANQTQRFYAGRISSQLET